MDFSTKRIFWSIIMAGTEYESDKNKILRHSAFNFFSLLSFFIIFGFAIFNSSQGFPELLIVDMLMLFTSLVCYILNAMTLGMIARIIWLQSSPLYFLFYPLFIGDLGVEAYYVLFAIMSFFFIENRKLITPYLLYMVGIVIFTRYITSVTVYPEQYQSLQQTHDGTGYIFSFVLAGMVGIYVLSMKRHLEKRKQNSITS